MVQQSTGTTPTFHTPPPPNLSRLGRLAIWMRRHSPTRLPIVYQLSLMITMLIVVCMGLLGTVVLYHQSHILRRQMDDMGHSLAAQVARSAAEPLLAGDHLALEVLATNLVSGKTVLGTAIMSIKGKVVVRAGITPFQADGPLSGTPQQRRQHIMEDLNWTATPPDSKHPVPVASFAAPIRFQHVVAGYALVTFNRSTMDEFRRDTIRTIVAATCIMILLGMVLSYLLSRQLSRPIHDLIDANRAFDEGHYHFRFPDRRHDEIGQLMGAYNRLADSMLQKEQVEAALSRYLSPGVARAVMDNLDSVQLGGQRVEASVLFADIVGFTSMSEQMNPEKVATLLNHYFTYIAAACGCNGGMVDKYIGDEAMLVFGVPEHDEDHVFHAITCGLTIQRLVEHENRLRQQQGELPVQFRFGINSGTMLAGNMGARDRMEYTVVGDSVNLASRLCSVADAGQIVISEQLYRQPEIHDRVVARRFEAIRLRGIEHPVTTYRVESLAGEHQEAVLHQVAAILGGSAS
ncbi:MAG TPA: adenylate/guanylate cyclase domain-containing protein [Gammaproteobacteria bacterium]|nr:adenylate/guanylate cyclase domain-containing protein [Gammaproteobacteria bacterium]